MEEIIARAKAIMGCPGFAKSFFIKVQNKLRNCETCKKTTKTGRKRGVSEQPQASRARASVTPQKENSSEESSTFFLKIYIPSFDIEI